MRNDHQDSTHASDDSRQAACYLALHGAGRAGYNFTLLLSDSIADTTIANENQFNDDWDGDRLHAVAENGDT